MEDILKRLAKIIAMTDSPDVEEARTAAMTAIGLIKKHKIEFRLPASSGAKKSSTESARTPTDFAEQFWQEFGPAYARSSPEGMTEEFKRQWKARNGQHSGADAPPSYPWPTGSAKAEPATPDPKWRATRSSSYREAPAAKQDASPSAPPPASKPKKPPTLIVSKFAGPCKACSDKFSAGENVYWLKGQGVTHERCKAFWGDFDC